MKLSRREKYAVYLAAVCIFIFVIFQLVVFPILDKKEQLKRMLAGKTRTLQEMLVLQAEYDALGKKAEVFKERFAKRERGFSLFSFLDTLAGNAKIKDNITYMKPSRSDQKNSQYKISMVEMKFQSITLKQLIPYLHMVETSKNMVFIKRMSISKTSNREGFIDAVLQVETFEI